MVIDNGLPTRHFADAVMSAAPYVDIVKFGWGTSLVTQDLQRKIEDTLAGRRPYEPVAYPYFSPDYKLPFLHIGTEKQLFVDNFILEHLDEVERVIVRPEKHSKLLLEYSGLPWEETAFNPLITATLYDPDDRKFKMWYTQSLTGDPYGTGQVLCYAESADALTWERPLRETCIPYKGHKATNIVHASDADGSSVAVRVAES